MNSTSPSWLKTFKPASELLSNSAAVAPGHNSPRSDGPSAMPARISATTCGCPSRFASAPNTRAVTRMAATWKSTSARGPGAGSMGGRGLRLVNVRQARQPQSPARFDFQVTPA